jgi:ADP-sugar diphosphatase
MENFKDSLKFRIWADELSKNGLTIDSVEEKYSLRKRSGEILFSLLHVDAKDGDGHPILPLVLLRGHFVAVITVLIDKDSKEKFFLLVKQRRVATGGFFYEHPAGMCDSETDPYKVALKEVSEETGLHIQKENLELIWEIPLYSSPGLLDEAGYFFSCEIELSKNEILKYSNKSTGALDENERIETFLCPEKDIFQYLQNSTGIMLSMLYLNKKNNISYQTKNGDNFTSF